VPTARLSFGLTLNVTLPFAGIASTSSPYSNDVSALPLTVTPAAPFGISMLFKFVIEICFAAEEVPFLTGSKVIEEGNTVGSVEYTLNVPVFSGTV
jgi:hypothetical protein